MMVVDIEAVTTGWSLFSAIAGALIAAGAGWGATRATIGRIESDLKALSDRAERDIKALGAELAEDLQNIREDREEDQRAVAALKSDTNTKLTAVEGRILGQDLKIGVIMESIEWMKNGMTALGLDLGKRLDRMEDKIDKVGK